MKHSLFVCTPNTHLSQSRRQNNKPAGFTIVELLIVIVIIGILAAITVVAYNGITGRANDSIVKSNLQSTMKKLELAKVDLGRYPSATSEMPQLSLTKSSYDTTRNGQYYCHNLDNGEYAFSFVSKSGKFFVAGSTVPITEVSGVTGVSTCNLVGADWTGGTGNRWVTYGYVGSTSNWLAWTD